MLPWPCHQQYQLPPTANALTSIDSTQEYSAFRDVMGRDVMGLEAHVHRCVASQPLCDDLFTMHK